MDQTSNLLYLNTNQSTAQGFLFGLQIPFLPDFLLDHTLLGKEPSDRIQEYSRRWTEFVSGWWRNQEDVTYDQNPVIQHFSKQEQREAYQRYQESMDVNKLSFEEWLDQNPEFQYLSEEQQREAYENYLSSWG